MNEQDKDLMEKHGITYSTEVIYRYKNFRYKKLEEAINYAKIDTKRDALKPSDEV